MTILSTDKMASISRAAIRKLVKSHFKVNITDGGADEIAKILEDEAAAISHYAVGSAKTDKRDRVTKKDISDYIIKGKG